MKKSKSLFLVSSILMGFLFSVCGQAQSQAKYPTRPINVIVPYSAGGAIDITSRVLATNLSER